jgi:ATP-binding cassette subfamily C protein PrsD
VTRRSGSERGAFVALLSVGLGGPVAALVVLSVLSNLLMLTGPLFMLQVYDRVLAAYSVPTLVALTIIAAVLYALFGVVDAVRSHMVLRFGHVVDARVRPRLFRAAVRSRLGGGAGSEPTSDGDALQQFTSSAGVLSFLDLPWMPVYVAIVFTLHPGLGWLALAGVVIVSGLMVVNELAARAPAAEAHGADAVRRQRLDDARVNAESAVAMGMLDTLELRWEEATQALRRAQARSTDRSSTVSAISKSLRFLLQSSVLALGAYYVIQGQMSAGSILASSVITARALAPVEQVVAHWKGFLTARRALTRIAAVYRVPDVQPVATRLPAPSATLDVDDLTVFAPDRSAMLLRGVTFQLRAGDALGVIGPSGSGKTTLARALVGAWPLAGGTVRLDGAELSSYGLDRAGEVVGYLPQRVELFDGTVAQNISRFMADPSPDDILDAARVAGVHALILRLPQGYDTPIGPQGGLLSAGQRQRIGLARAVFGFPFLVVLDEPNSNLDSEGDGALTAAIHALREAGSVVVVNAHRPSAIEATSHILTVNDGRQAGFGPRDEVLTRLKVKVQ